MNELKELMRQSVAAPPPDHFVPDTIVRDGRARVRRRRRTVALGATSALVVAAVAVAAVGRPGGTGTVAPADDPPRPDAPTLRLGDAEQAVEGEDYRVLASYTNENLNRDNGQYFEGVTDDGLILFRDGPRMGQLYPRMALLDPATGTKDWLPDLDVGQIQTWPVELGTERLVLLALHGGPKQELVAYVFDRAARRWSTISWPSLPHVGFQRATMAPDGRIYVSVPATQGRPPEGGWPVGPGGEAEDADAEGDTYHLWSVSLSDPSDVRDESLTVGSVAFTDSSMVWTDSTNGDAGRVHVRDLATGEEHSFDPRAGDRCNLLSFGATDDRIVMGQYCGTYDGGVRDDRVQILTTDGDQVVTIQDSGIDGGLGVGSDLVAVSSYEPDVAGTYVYDLGSDEFLRLTDGVSSWSMGDGPTPPRQLIWDTPVNERRGATQWLGEVLD